MKNFAEYTAQQFTYRELQAQLSKPRYWIVLAVVIFLLTMIGPFYTLTSLTFSARLVYWAFITFINYLVGLSVSLYVGHQLFTMGLPEWASRMISGFVSGIPIAPIVWSFNTYIYHFDMSEFGFFNLLGYCAVIAMAISLLIYLVSLEVRKLETPAPASLSNDKSALSPFLRRLPAHIGKDILSLEAQDHYVNVTTPIGSALVLMRLADAIEELTGIDGMRIHRSHWIAKTAIVKTLRKDGKQMVELTNGATLPISRTYAKSLKDLMV